jgi:hypothetical protein
MPLFCPLSTNKIFGDAYRELRLDLTHRRMTCLNLIRRTRTPENRHAARQSLRQFCLVTGKFWVAPMPLLKCNFLPAEFSLGM